MIFKFYLLFRACRLRKKAQHEANKLKLHGLNEEHSKTCFSLVLFIRKKRNFFDKHDIEWPLIFSFFFLSFHKRLGVLSKRE